MGQRGICVAKGEMIRLFCSSICLVSNYNSSRCAYWWPRLANFGLVRNYEALSHPDYDWVSFSKESYHTPTNLYSHLFTTSLAHSLSLR